MATPGETCASGTRVENLLKALNQCLDMNSDESSIEESHQSTTFHETSNGLHMNGTQSYHADNGIASDCLSTGYKNANQIQSNGIDHHSGNGNDIVRTADSCHTNGTVSDIANDITSNNLLEKSKNLELADDAGVESTAEPKAPTSSEADDKDVKNGSTSTEASAAGDEEESGESLLAKRLVVVMEKLEAYRATRNYMVALSNKLKEENARYEAEYGNTSGELETGASSNESASDLQNAEVHKGNELHDNDANSQKLEKVSDLGDVDNNNDAIFAGMKQTEKLNNSNSDQLQETKSCLQSEQSSAQNKLGLAKTGLNDSNPVNIKSSQNKSKSNSHSNANHEEVEDDDEMDYEDYYYDVSEDIDYVSGSDNKSVDEVTLKQSPINSLLTSQPDSSLNENKNLQINKNKVESQKGAENCSNITDDKASKQESLSDSDNNKKSSSSKMATDSDHTEKPADKTTDHFKGAYDKTEDLDSSTRVSSSTKTSEVKSTKDTEEHKSSKNAVEVNKISANRLPEGKEVFDLSRVERLNLMLRLQTEFARLQLQTMEMQESMRKASAALQGLVALENGEGEGEDGPGTPAED